MEVGFIEFLAHPKYRHVNPFRGIAGWLMTRNIGGDAGNTVPDNVLVSADGYILTDKNGVYLVPKESE